MLTGGLNEVIPFTVSALKCYFMFIPHMYRGVVVHEKMRYNKNNLYPPGRINIRGDYIH